LKKPACAFRDIARMTGSPWLEHSPDSVLVTDAAGVIEYVNPAFEALTGYSRAEALGRSAAILKSGVQEPDFYRRLWRSILAGRSFRGVFVNRKKGGELYHVENLIWPVFDSPGRIAHFVCAGRDVTAQVGEVEKLAHAATHDPLTDLPNRTLYLDRLGQALRHAARQGETLAVALMDLDRFREINNRFGHFAGDAVLRSVASRTRACVREADTVARIGGDEFALLLTGADQAAARRILEKIVAAQRAPVRFEAADIVATVSVGACCYPRDASGEEKLQKLADAAMYEAKRAGGDRCALHDDHRIGR
jgi:diguanylate cyclase (GGDEF)-like protein/PAS domain S-box-containing protein